MHARGPGQTLKNKRSGVKTNNLTQFPTRSDTNQPVESQKQARSLNFRFKKKRGCTMRLAKTKGLIS